MPRRFFCISAPCGAQRSEQTMKTYAIPLVPGPTSVPHEYREAYLTDYGSSDLEEEFFELLAENRSLLKKMLNASGDVIIGSGEGMAALWGAMKSVIKPGDKVLAISNGVFGRGFGEIAEAIGARAEYLEAPDGKFVSKEELRARLAAFCPDVVTAVHCETPSGLLNPISEIAEAVAESGALFVADFVASAGGTPVDVDGWRIDLGLMGSQKCLSILPDLNMITVSERAWKRAEETGYAGYDALTPWKRALDERLMPYTHNWHANAALNIALKHFFGEGADNVFRRHSEAAAYCRARARDLGLRLYAADESLCSPTVTALTVPVGRTWKELDAAFRAEGLAVGGSYGALAGKVFRIGHMGSQADRALVERGMDVIEKVLRK